MSLVELLAHPVARQLTLALLHFVWQGLAIAVVLMLIVELLGIRRPQTRYACSLAALALMLACPVATFWLLGATDEPAVGWTSGPSLNVLAESHTDGSEVHPTIDAAAAVAWLEPAQPYLLAAWLLGVAIFAGRLSAGAIGVLRLRQKLIPLPLDLARDVERLGRRLAIDALPVVFLSRRVSEAMAVGVLRPLVLIPAAWATEMPLEMLEAVIAHELAHLRRRDLWVNLLQRIAEAVLFYHPAVWWLSRRLRQERELCADALAVAATGRRLQYAEALEQVARLRQADVGPALAAFMRGGKNMRLLERVRNVLGLGAAGDRSRLWPAGLVILALPLALWALSLGLNAAVADDERDDDDRPRVAREVADDDDDDREEGRREKDDDDDDDEKEGRGDKEDDDDDKEKEGKGEDKDEEGERKEVRKDGDVKKDAPRDGDAPRKKEGPRDGDAPKKEVARDGDAPRKEIRKDAPRKEGDRPIKEGAREGDKKIVKEGLGPDAAVAELKQLVAKLMAENERLRAELAAARGGGKDVIKKEGGDKEVIKKDVIKKEGADIKKEGADKEVIKKELFLKDPAAAERKEAELKELRARKERAAAEAKEGAARKEREGDEKAAIEKKRAIAEKEEAAARARLKEAIEKKEGDRKDAEKKEGAEPK
jgi:beta-lactamase regulating signal transducer with metallopeptidase domain